ncbi:hypothetical protein L9F63_007976, partial [Diploptera punctata]
MGVSGVGILMCRTPKSGCLLQYAMSEQEGVNRNPIQEWDDSLLLLSTLDGSFYGVGQKTGYIRWKLQDEPAVKVPVDTTKAIILQDPKDGSLYVLGSSGREALKKLPFTIPQLVASSPCRSSDGILYTGKKMDTWFAINAKTGVKQEVVSFNKPDKTCPIDSSDAVFIGRSEYNIMMFDSKQQERSWNVTFFDYSSSVMEADALNNYEYVHFTASSTGRTLSLDRRVGSLLWECDYGSPVIAMYILENEELVSVPFTSVAEETMEHLVTQFTSSSEQIKIGDNMKLYPTLYVGEHVHGLYAVPSLVDQNTATIAPAQTGLLLLEGPAMSQTQQNPSGTYFDSTDLPLPGHNSLPKDKRENMAPVILLGYYKMPDYSKTVLQITGRSDKIISNPNRFPILDDNDTDLRGQTEKPAETLASVCKQRKEFVTFSYGAAKLWLNKQENKGLKLIVIVLAGCIFAVVWYYKAQVREFQQLSQGSRSSNRPSSGHYQAITAYNEDVGDGNERVGKITFNINEKLGNGCEGTFVY